MAIATDAFLQNRVREGGSGFTAFQWEGHIIGFAKSIANQSPRPVAAPVPIQPMDKRYPIQILTPGALGAGQLQVRLFERYNHKVWDDLMNITATSHGINVPNGGFNDLVQIFITLAALRRPVTCVKIINPPTIQGQTKNNTSIYGDVYHNCVITDIRDDEDVDITMMEVLKVLTIGYTRVTRFPGKFASLGGDFGGIARADLSPTSAFAI